MMSAIKDRIKRNSAESTQSRTTIPTGPAASSASIAEFKNRKQFKNACILPTAKIDPDLDQPRKTFPAESIARLSQSLTAVGQLVPLIVRYNEPTDRYIILDGERRYQAATLAGLFELACVVESEANRDTILEIQLVVNALREDVNPMEQARAWGRLADSKKMSLRDLAKMLNYDHSVIGRKISLLDLPEEIQAAIEAKEISQEMGIGLALVDDPTEQAELAERIKAGDMTRQEMRQRAAQRKATGKGGATKPKAKAKPKPRTTWTYKGEAGLRITAERAKGIDLTALLVGMESAVEQIRGELANAG